MTTPMPADTPSLDCRDLIQTGIDLAGERDLVRLQIRLVTAAAEIAQAAGGILYMWDDAERLVPQTLHFPDLDLPAKSEGAAALCTALAGIVPVVDRSGVGAADWLPAQAIAQRDTLQVPTLQGQSGAADIAAFDRDTLFQSGAGVVIPLSLGPRSLGSLLLIRSVEAGAFAAQPVAYAALLVAQAAGHINSLQMYRRMVTTSSALMAERDPQALLERIIVEAKYLSAADGALLFLRTPDNDLDAALIEIDSKGLRQDGHTKETSALRPVHLFDPQTGAPNRGTYASLAALDQKTIKIGDVHLEQTDAAAAVGQFDKAMAYQTQSILAVPMVDRRRETLGVLYLVNARDIMSDEIVSFGDDVSVMIETLARQAAEALDNQAVYRELVETGISLSAELDHDLLLEKILLEAKEICHAEGGSLYLITEDERLEFSIVHNDHLKIAMGGKTGQPITLPALRLYDDEGNENHNAVATHVALSGETVNIQDAYEVEDYDFSGAKKFDESQGYRSKSFLTVPLKDRDNQVIGVLQLINARDWVTEEIVPFNAQVQPLVESLASQAAVALNNQQLMQAQKDLLVSFIQLIAGAIDAKSPYTGGHCQRVPELTMMLTKAAVKSEAAPFADFDLNADELYELQIAGLLHDCGKVTTPEYVVDKATKLETIYNRLHEVRTRFEVCKREAEITYYKGLAEGGDAAALKQTLDAELTALDDDYAFVAECNIGGEFMDDGKLERLAQIAARTWTRTLPARIGLSQSEETDLCAALGIAAADWAQARDTEALPVTEPLLYDADHHITRRNAAELGKVYAQYGIKMDIPEHAFNRGELYNLSIRRGTLTEEERFKINDHIIQTIIMLNHLPFPRTLRRVPEYAGGHHEKMDGTGYPRRLMKEEMSLPARVMAIADIFEALTANDRPYKPPKTLSQALKIMSFMVKDAHIDPDLFQLFLESGVYKEYGDAFLDPSQVDEVDVSQYLAH
ncbi:MAG: HD domain-containing phosphohydrolase [Magnetospiraceae bacterium]